MGEGRNRRQVEGQQLGQEARAAGAAERSNGLRPVQGYATQEAAPVRAAEGSCQGQGLSIREGDEKEG